jgi:hypothetical protein
MHTVTFLAHLADTPHAHTEGVPLLIILAMTILALCLAWKKTG